MVKHVLILGGTGEARKLAQRIKFVIGKRGRITTSLAGMRSTPPNIPGEIRNGGFGGIKGLIAYLARNTVDIVIDATHPFSRIISNHATIACGDASNGGIHRLQLMRPPSLIPPSAKWVEVDDLKSAANYLPNIARRVLLTTGIRGLESFSNLEDLWFLVRLIDKPKTPPPLVNFQVITGRPPYTLKCERAILVEHSIDALVTKDAGGRSMDAKIFAAAEAGVKIVLIRRPAPEPGPVAETVDEALAWIEAMV